MTCPGSLIGHADGRSWAAPKTTTPAAVPVATNRTTAPGSLLCVVARRLQLLRRSDMTLATSLRSEAVCACRVADLGSDDGGAFEVAARRGGAGRGCG
jgi:hypothetical protein